MEYVKLKELMVRERMLLEIDVRIKFDLVFNDALKLHKYLKEIGSITSYSFLLQQQHFDKFGDKDKLKEYHEMLMNNLIEYDLEDVDSFIDKILWKYENEELRKIIEQIKKYNYDSII